MNDGGYLQRCWCPRELIVKIVFFVVVIDVCDVECNKEDGTEPSTLRAAKALQQG